MPKETPKRQQPPGWRNGPEDCARLFVPAQEEAAGDISPVPSVMEPRHIPAVRNQVSHQADAVHAKLVGILAAAFDAISADTIPPSIRAFAQYAPDKHAALNTALLLSSLREHHEFRAEVVRRCSVS